MYSNGIYVVKKIVSILLMIAAVAAIGGSALYTLAAFHVLKLDAGTLFLSTTTAVIGGFSALGLSIISIIFSCIARVRRPNVLIGIIAVLMGACAFLMYPFTSLGNALKFGLSFPSLASSALYADFPQFFGIGLALFAIIALITAAVDFIKTGRGE